MIVNQNGCEKTRTASNGESYSRQCVEIEAANARNGFRVLLTRSYFSEACAQPMKLTVSYTGTGLVNLPVVLAKEAGIFARNGLEVTVVRSQAAVSTMSGQHCKKNRG